MPGASPAFARLLWRFRCFTHNIEYVGGMKPKFVTTGDLGMEQWIVIEDSAVSIIIQVDLSNGHPHALAFVVLARRNFSSESKDEFYEATHNQVFP